MNRHKIFGCLVLSAIASLVVAPASAQAMLFSEVLTDGSVGSGAKQAMIVFDWKSGVTQSHAWLYRWDESATVADAFNAIDAAESAFSWSHAAFVTELDYDDGVDYHMGDRDGWMSFWNSSDGENWTTNNLGVMAQPLVHNEWSGANPIANPWPGSAPVVPTPEPATIGLLAAGAGAILLRLRRRR